MTPWLQARDNIRMEPSLTCLEPPTTCMLPPPEQLIMESMQAFPTHGTILSPDYDADRLWSRAAFTKGCMTHHGPSGFLSNLALVILAHSLPAMDVSLGNQSPGMAWLNEWRCTCLLILIISGRNYLMNYCCNPSENAKEQKKKCDFKPICPLGSILEFHIGIK